MIHLENQVTKYVLHFLKTKTKILTPHLHYYHHHYLNLRLIAMSERMKTISLMIQFLRIILKTRGKLLKIKLGNLLKDL